MQNSVKLKRHDDAHFRDSPFLILLFPSALSVPPPKFILFEIATLPLLLADYKEAGLSVCCFCLEVIFELTTTHRSSCCPHFFTAWLPRAHLPKVCKGSPLSHLRVLANTSDGRKGLSLPHNLASGRRVPDLEPRGLAGFSRGHGEGRRSPPPRDVTKKRCGVRTKQCPVAFSVSVVLLSVALVAGPHWEKPAKSILLAVRP